MHEFDRRQLPCGHLQPLACQRLGRRLGRLVRGVRRGSLRQSRLFLGRRSSYGLGRLGRCLRRLRLCRLRPRNRLLGRRLVCGCLFRSGLQGLLLLSGESRGILARRLLTRRLQCRLLLGPCLRLRLLDRHDRRRRLNLMLLGIRHDHSRFEVHADIASLSCRRLLLGEHGGCLRLCGLLGRLPGRLLCCRLLCRRLLCRRSRCCLHGLLSRRGLRRLLLRPGCGRLGLRRLLLRSGRGRCGLRLGRSGTRLDGSLQIRLQGSIHPECARDRGHGGLRLLPTGHLLELLPLLREGRFSLLLIPPDESGLLLGAHRVVQSAILGADLLKHRLPRLFLGLPRLLLGPGGGPHLIVRFELCRRETLLKLRVRPRETAPQPHLRRHVSRGEPDDAERPLIPEWG